VAAWALIGARTAYELARAVGAVKTVVERRDE
jgi:hypothetical protein